MTRSPLRVLIGRRLAATAVLAAASLTAASAHAAKVFDAQGDFLDTTYRASADPASAPLPKNADLDIRSAQVTFDGAAFHLIAQVWGQVGASVDANGVPLVAYVWGVNRGAGAAVLDDANHTPHIRPDLDFDMSVVVKATTQMFTQLPTATVPTPYDPTHNNVTISGDTIIGTIKLADLPSTGFAPEDYTFSLWTKFGQGSNNRIADFDPNGQPFTASVPEPASWAMMIMGFGLVGGMARVGARARRSRVAA